MNTALISLWSGGKFWTRFRAFPTFFPQLCKEFADRMEVSVKDFASSPYYLNFVADRVPFEMDRADLLRIGDAVAKHALSLSPIQVKVSDIGCVFDWFLGSVRWFSLSTITKVKHNCKLVLVVRMLFLAHTCERLQNRRTSVGPLLYVGSEAIRCR
jgi:hypothetical protein